MHKKTAKPKQGSTDKRYFSLNNAVPPNSKSTRETQQNQLTWTKKKHHCSSTKYCYWSALIGRHPRPRSIISKHNDLRPTNTTLAIIPRWQSDRTTLTWQLGDPPLECTSEGSPQQESLRIFLRNDLTPKIEMVKLSCTSPPFSVVIEIKLYKERK